MLKKKQKLNLQPHEVSARPLRSGNDGVGNPGWADTTKKMYKRLEKFEKAKLEKAKKQVGQEVLPIQAGETSQGQSGLRRLSESEGKLLHQDSELTEALKRFSAISDKVSEDDATRSKYERNVERLVCLKEIRDALAQRLESGDFQDTSSQFTHDQQKGVYETFYGHIEKVTDYIMDKVQKLYKRYEKGMSTQEGEISQGQDGDNRLSLQERQLLNQDLELAEHLQMFVSMSEKTSKKSYRRYERNRNRLEALDKMYTVLTERLSSQIMDLEEPNPYKKLHDLIKGAAPSILRVDGQARQEYLASKPEETAITQIAQKMLLQDNLRHMQEPLGVDGQTQLGKAIAYLEGQRTQHSSSMIDLNPAVTNEDFADFYEPTISPAQLKELERMLGNGKMQDASHHLDAMKKEVGRLVLKQDLTEREKDQIVALEMVLEGKGPAQRKLEAKGYQFDLVKKVSTAVQDPSEASVQWWPQTVELKPIRDDAEPLTLQDVHDYSDELVDEHLKQRAIKKIEKEVAALLKVNELLDGMKGRSLGEQIRLLKEASEDVKESCAYKVIEKRLRLIDEKGADKVKNMLVGQAIEEQLVALPKVIERVGRLRNQGLTEQLAVVRKEEDDLVTSSLVFEAIVKRLDEIYQCTGDPETKQSQAKRAIDEWVADMPKLTEHLKHIQRVRVGGISKKKGLLEEKAAKEKPNMKGILEGLAEVVQDIFRKNPDHLPDQFIKEQREANKRNLPLLRSLTYYGKTGEKPAGLPWGIESFWSGLECKSAHLGTHTRIDEDESVLYATTEATSLAQAFGYKEKDQNRLCNVFNPENKSDKLMRVVDKKGVEIETWRQAYADDDGHLPVKDSKASYVHLGYSIPSSPSKIVAWIDKRTNMIHMGDQEGPLSLQIEPGKKIRYLYGIRVGNDVLKSYLQPLL